MYQSGKNWFKAEEASASRSGIRDVINEEMERYRNETKDANKISSSPNPAMNGDRLFTSPVKESIFLSPMSAKDANHSTNYVATEMKRKSTSQTPHEEEDKQLTNVAKKKKTPKVKSHEEEDEQLTNGSKKKPTPKAVQSPESNTPGGVQSPGSVPENVIGDANVPERNANVPEGSVHVPEAVQSPESNTPGGVQSPGFVPENVVGDANVPEGSVHVPERNANVPKNQKRKRPREPSMNTEMKLRSHLRTAGGNVRNRKDINYNQSRWRRRIP